MANYLRMYRWGVTPWERYGTAAAASIAAQLDAVESGRPTPLGRALDLGCGRGQYTPELARRGWAATGIDYVPAAIAAARATSPAPSAPGEVSYVVGDVTDLARAGLGRFDLFFDVGCFQGFDAAQRRAVGRGVTDLANPSATVLLMAFGPSRWRERVGGVSKGDVEIAFPGWELRTVEPAQTDGLGWPMNRTCPQWYRLTIKTDGAKPTLP